MPFARERAPATALWCVIAAACGGTESEPEPTLPLPPAGCQPGETPLEPDGCAPAGVPPERCAPGFEPIDGGCAAVLPPAPCPPGQMALFGETVCRPVAPCAEGTWGDIAIEPGTQHVDGAYAGGSSNGSAAQPWTTIGAAVAAAAPGALVAVAAGSYAESVDLVAKPVRVRGRCPGLVEVLGQPGFDAVIIRTGASGSEVHDLAARGSPRGVAVSGSTGIVLSRLWVHDTEGPGVVVLDQLGPTQVTLVGSLVENAVTAGVGVDGTDVTLDRSVVRGTRSDASQSFGMGVSAGTSGFTGARSTLTVVGSLVEQSQSAGIRVEASTAAIDGSLVRDTQPVADGSGGRGLDVYEGAAGRGELFVTSSVVERAHELGVFVGGADAHLEAIVVRDTLPSPGGVGGRGIDVEDLPDTGARSVVEVAWSLVDLSREIGVHVSGSDATLESTLVRDTLPRELGGIDGRGINVEANPASGQLANVAVRRSHVLRSHALGLSVLGSGLLFEDSAVRETLAQAADGSVGRGIGVQFSSELGVRATATIAGSLVEASREAGVAVLGADATLTDTVLRDTRGRDADGQFGDGIVVHAIGGGSSAFLTGLTIEQSHRAGVATFGAFVEMGTTTLECNGIHLDGEPHEGQDGHLTDAGGNACGCAGVAVECKLLSSQLEPPAPI
jgi:hypothetical protein